MASAQSRLESLGLLVLELCESQLISKNPRSINEMKLAVEGIVSNIPQDMVRRVAANVNQRVSKSSEKYGGLFECFLSIVNECK